MKLITRRLEIRNIEYNDMDFLYKVLSKDEVTNYLTYESLKNKSEVVPVMVEYLKDENEIEGHFTIILKRTNDVIGFFGIHSYDYKNKSVEFEFMLEPDYTGYGYMQEALKEMINYAFSKDEIEKIIVACYEENERCKNLISKYPFKYEYQECKEIENKGIKTIVYYSLYKEEYI